MSDPDVRVRAEARVGATLLGKYHLDRIVGVGAMAVVYAATHRNGKEFAVKLLHSELSHRSDVRARFLREGYAANAVRHPGAVAVLDDDVAEDGAAFLVMELLEGETVENLWLRSRRRLSLDQVMAIGHPLLDVLVSAHARGIVHRDIKPANLFLTVDGQLKVLDFGIARLRDAAFPIFSGATQTGMMMGTPAFMAPEQALAKASEIDGQTDVWAVGATLFTLLTGERVHDGENAQQLLVKAATTPARPLAAVLAEVPAPMAHVIDRALAYDKSARWPSAAAMAEAMREISPPPSRIRPSLVPPAGQDPRASSPGTVDVGGWPVPAPLVPHGPYATARTTSRPVSGESAMSLPGGRRRKVVAGLTGGGLFLLVAAIGVAVKLSPPHTSDGRAPSVTTSRVDAQRSASPEAGLGSVGEGTAVDAGEAPARPDVEAGGTGASPAANDAGAVGASPVTHEHVGAARPPATTNPTAHPTAHAHNCSPPFYFDSDGNKHFRPECY